MARQLIAMGFEAAALVGGFNAWRAAQPVEPKIAHRLPIEDRVPERTGHPA